MNLYADPDVGSSEKQELTIRDVAALLKRRRSIVVIVCATFLLLAAVKCIFGTRRYEADASIQIQKDDADALGLESALGTAVSGASDALDYNVTLQTQAKILNSNTLALAVIKSNGLENNDDFTGIHAWFHIPPWLTPWDQPTTEAASLSVDQAPERRRRALKTFAKRFKVEIEPGTRIINISFLSTDPETASNVVNSTIEEFREFNFKTRSAATAQVSEWLQGQLDGIEKQATASQEKVLRIQRENPLFTPDEGHNVVLSRLDQLNADLVSKEADTMVAQALDRVVATGDPEAVWTLNLTGGAAGSSNSSSILIPVQQLRAREADLKASLRQNSTKFDRNYPLVLQQQAQLQSVDRSIQEEITRIGKRTHSNYQVALRAEKDARQSFEKQRTLVQKLSGSAMEYIVAKEDADASRELLEDSKKKVVNANLLSGLRSNNVTIVDPGRVPSHKNPKEPKIILTLALGLVGGLCAGCAIALIVDNRDKGIYSSDQIENLLGSPPFAVLPSFQVARGWPRGLPQLPTRAHLKALSGRRSTPGQLLPMDPNSTYAEALRSLRTSLMLSRSQQYPKVIVVTSAQPGEGKSTTTLHLATILGQQGRRVLVVDGDLRRSSLHEKLNVPNERGLSTMLSEVDAPTALRSIGGRDDVWILPAGPRPPFPAELLSSPGMQSLVQEWSANFDFILIDTPPALPVTDAVLLSRLADITLLIARQHVSTMQGIKSAYRKLGANGDLHNVAVVLNGVERTSADVADYYSYAYKLPPAGVVNDAA